MGQTPPALPMTLIVSPGDLQGRPAQFQQHRRIAEQLTRRSPQRTGLQKRQNRQRSQQQAVVNALPVAMDIQLIQMIEVPNSRCNATKPSSGPLDSVVAISGRRPARNASTTFC
jgi:uncharacterized metal-binding protein YceD (DUF177 family)